MLMEANSYDFLLVLKMFDFQISICLEAKNCINGCSTQYN
jgi:hypothetical protein